MSFLPKSRRLGVCCVDFVGKPTQVQFRPRCSATCANMMQSWADVCQILEGWCLQILVEEFTLIYVIYVTCCIAFFGKEAGCFGQEFFAMLLAAVKFLYKDLVSRQIFWSGVCWQALCRLASITFHPLSELVCSISSWWKIHSLTQPFKYNLLHGKAVLVEEEALPKPWTPLKARVRTRVQLLPKISPSDSCNMWALASVLDAKSSSVSLVRSYASKRSRRFSMHVCLVARESNRFHITYI